MSEGYIWRKIEGCCAYCDAPFTEQTPRTRDHVVPRNAAKSGLGGRNIVDTCEPCNHIKANFGPRRLRKMAREHETKAERLRQIADRAEQIIKERKLL